MCVFGGTRASSSVRAALWDALNHTMEQPGRWLPPSTNTSVRPCAGQGRGLGTHGRSREAGASAPGQHRCVQVRRSSRGSCWRWPGLQRHCSQALGRGTAVWGGGQEGGACGTSVHTWSAAAAPPRGPRGKSQSSCVLVFRAVRSGGAEWVQTHYPHLSTQQGLLGPG